MQIEKTMLVQNEYGQHLNRTFFSIGVFPEAPIRNRAVLRVGEKEKNTNIINFNAQLGLIQRCGMHDLLKFRVHCVGIE